MVPDLLIFTLFMTNCIVAEVNIAQGKIVKQSSILKNYGPQLAVDGIKNQTVSCSQTNEMVRPWWIVDLGVLHNISSVTVYLDTYCCYKYSRDFEVYAFQVTHKETGSTCTKEFGKEVGNIHSVTCNPQARYIMIKKLSYFRGILHVCEVEITGTAVGIKKEGKFCKTTQKLKIQDFSTINVRSLSECAFYCRNRPFCSTFNVKPLSNGVYQCFLLIGPVTDNILYDTEEHLYYEYSKFTYYEAYAFKTTNQETGSKCSTKSNSLTTKILSFKCKPQARYLMIQHISIFSSILHVCEVQITGVTVGTKKEGKFCKTTRTMQIQEFTRINVRSLLECAVYCRNRPFCSTFNVKPLSNGVYQYFLLIEPATPHLLNTSEESVYYEC